ncbi:MAG TPA: hypothetical protein VKG89_01625 [Solirubrobacterales bacterium]|nr:hypothetical protein [Solirubrobacterales bacterium]
MTLAIELQGGGSVRLRFESATLGAAGGPGDDGLHSPWSIEGEVDWRNAEALRLVSALFEDGCELAIASIRPRGAAGHDTDVVTSHLLEGGERVAVDEALVSTEYDPAGLPRRLGIELWIDPDSPPLRVAADREGALEAGGEGLRREVARMRFRLAGTPGTGLYEVLRPA